MRGAGRETVGCHHVARFDARDARVEVVHCVYNGGRGGCVRVGHAYIGTEVVDGLLLGAGVQGRVLHCFCYGHFVSRCIGSGAGAARVEIVIVVIYIIRVIHIVVNNRAILI